jgi:hypothetical protein
MKHRRVSIALTALLIGILACNLPGGGATETPTPAEDLAATITAQAETLQAPSATPGPPTETPTVTPTSTSSVPMVSVSSATNCRTGDGTEFAWLYTMNPGDAAQVVGKNTPSGYWIINYPGGQCWLWGQYATVTGDTSGLPEFPAPATPTPSELAAPSNFHATSSCSPSGVLLTENIHVSLTWTDNAPNEDGYRIYRGGNLLATLAANSTSYEDDTTILILVLLGTPNPTPKPAPSIKYAIEAFNSSGNSKQRELSIGCP